MIARRVTLIPSRRFWAALVGVGCVGALLVICVGVWLIISNRQGATFTGFEAINFSGAPCLDANNALRPGGAIKLVTGWIVEADVVRVIGNYQQQGWRPITMMRKSIEMLPPQTGAFNLLILRVRTYRAVSLSYTPDYSTQVRATTTLAICAP